MRNRNLSEEKKQKLVEYRKNHYLTHNKLLRDFLDFLKTLIQLNLFHELMLEIYGNSNFFKKSFKYFFNIKRFLNSF